jgi:transposase
MEIPDTGNALIKIDKNGKPVFPCDIYNKMKEFYHRHSYHTVDDGDSTLKPYISEKDVDIKKENNEALKHYLCQYFRKFSQEQLDNVKLFVTDLWETYKDISFTYFKHAKIIADRFHFSRYVVQAVDTLRKRVQSNLPKEEKRWFRRSRRLLLTRKHKIKREEDLEQLNYMLINFSEDLRIAYREKETFLDILHSSDSYDIKAKLFNDWICRNLNSPVEELVSVAKTYHHWAVEIRHALEFTYSNGCTEGVNNKIKTLKRLSFGMPNFTHFKARIMLLD